MFIKKEEKLRMQEQLSELTDYKEKQEEVINVLKKSQEDQASAFGTQLAVLEESKNNQLEMLKILSEQNSELQQTNKNMLEQRDKNEAVLVEALGQIANLKKHNTVVYTDEQRQKAAYALNLCMVSISQIVDYNDLYILDQEYEMILNNLNLENMPKDEALLNILKQTLDTITYFRMQEGDKHFIEKEYQHNVKNALWASVPRNLNIMTCGESPWALAISAALSLTCQVGTGYMNYRRNKADYAINKDKQNWQLQRSAMEQFNGLRRDLFDTAWRLADEYRFADELRLTEKQIDLYNDILDDPDDYRRYERLETISGAFEAYPPFWFFFGDTAARIAIDFTENLELASKFKYMAMQHFEKFIGMSGYNLLRENTLLSTCALEYIDLLNISNDAEKINQLLEIAVNNSGNDNDIIELLGVAYMKIGDYEHAANAYRRLINEGYNVSINVQLLSSLYVQDYLDNPDSKRKSEIEDLYATLIKRTRGNNAFRLPVNSGEDWNVINTEFVYTQQDRVIEQFNNVLDELEKKYNILYNKQIPLDVKKNKEYVDSWYVDDGVAGTPVTEKRYNEIAKNLKKEGRFANYYLMYAEESYSEKTLELFSSMIKCVEKYLSDVIELDDTEELAIISQNSDLKPELAEYITDRISFHSNAFKYLDACFEKTEATDQFMTAVREVNYKALTNSYFVELSRRGEVNIRKINNMSDLFRFESNLRSLCVDQDIRIRSRLTVNAEEEESDTNIPLEIIYGDNAQSKREDKLSNLNKKRELVSILKEYEKEFIRNPNEIELLTDKSDINMYVSQSAVAKKLSRTNIIAILDDVGKKNKDIIFTLDGMYFIGNDRYVSSGEIFKYQDTLFNKTTTITFVRKRTVKHTQKFVNPAINMERMYAMIMDIAAIVKE